LGGGLASILSNDSVHETQYQTIYNLEQNFDFDLAMCAINLVLLILDILM